MAAAFGAALAEAGGCSAGRGPRVLREAARAQGGKMGQAQLALPSSASQCGMHAPPSASAGGHLDAAASGKAYAHAAGQQAHALQADSEAAAARLQDACRSLVQVVWITSVPRATLEELLD